MDLARIGLLTVGITISSAPSAARWVPIQDTTQQVEAVRVFLDCQRFFCDFDHFRREIAYVNWVRDRQDADVHVLGTRQATGGGGGEYTLEFIGLRQFQNQGDTLVYVAGNTDTQVEIRNGLTRRVALGLVRFAARTPVAERLDIEFSEPAGQQEAAAGPVSDPWDLWVFTLRIGANFNGESQRRSVSGNGSFRANRTAENVKLDFELSSRLSRDETEVPELDTTFVNAQQTYLGEVLAVWSLDDHWSAGALAEAESSTFVNTDLRIEFGPAIEYNIYPYDESTRRQLTFRYSPRLASFNYDEVTVFGETDEILPKHVLNVGLSVQQPWGNINTTVEASQFLHDLKKHRVDLFTGLNIRLFRGLSLNLFTGVSRVKDQLFISGAGLTPEERLLRTRQFETDFFYFGNVSFSFRFGSQFANVVNPRMSGGGGFFFF